MGTLTTSSTMRTPSLKVLATRSYLSWSSASPSSQASLRYCAGKQQLQSHVNTKLWIKQDIIQSATSTETKR